MPKSKWHDRALEKEKARHSNTPRPIKNDRFAVPVDFDNFAPTSDRGKNESKHRAT